MTEQQTHHDETIPPDLQATADLLREALAAEPMPAAAQPPATARKSKRPIQFTRFALPATAAAAILLMFGFVFGTMYSNQQQPVAMQNIEPVSVTELRDQVAFERATAQTLAEQIRRLANVPTKTPDGTLRNEGGAKVSETPAVPAEVVWGVKATDDELVAELGDKTSQKYTPRKRDLGAKQLKRTARSLNEEIRPVNGISPVENRTGTHGALDALSVRGPRGTATPPPGPSQDRDRWDIIRMSYLSWAFHVAESWEEGGATLGGHPNQRRRQHLGYQEAD